MTNFHRFIIRQRERHGYDLSLIGNMDETPVWFDMPCARTVNAKGEKTVLVKTTGHEKSRFTVVLACMANGVHLKPMIIFKRKTAPKGNFPSGLIIHHHPKGWMDADGIRLWIEKVWGARPGGLAKRRSFYWFGMLSVLILGIYQNLIYVRITIPTLL